MRASVSVSVPPSAPAPQIAIGRSANEASEACRSSWKKGLLGFSGWWLMASSLCRPDGDSCASCRRSVPRRVAHDAHQAGQVKVLVAVAEADAAGDDGQAGVEGGAVTTRLPMFAPLD